jgi:hypothetical protein
MMNLCFLPYWPVKIGQICGTRMLYINRTFPTAIAFAAFEILAQVRDGRP